ncbi:DUF4157 domain-containing protein [Frankia sp. QA3]|uniref:eCIS core domain-containing protein n=1 Tax=Frankia sp. QA3 TaxID=710111 RepID=UPI000269C008|nr:DUF4157 domain-containing protein [Frankia sp. QA3]EIV92970.1 hypothetical protein FraQA3DRAFT_2643 [Frankia sp. QA3]
MEADRLDGSRPTGAIRSGGVRRPDTVAPFDAVLSGAGNAAVGRAVRERRAFPAPGSASGRPVAGLVALARAVPGGGAVLRSALRSQGAGPLDPEIGDAIEGRRGAGAPLPEPVRAEMEGHLGVDLSPVRVHTDAAAATLNRAVQAEAFTTGTDVFFAPGRYDPASAAGRGLLAHELTHVVQQSTGAGGPGGTVSHPDDPAELEAAAIGAQVARQAEAHPAGAGDEEERVPAS